MKRVTLKYSSLGTDLPNINNMKLGEVALRLTPGHEAVIFRNASDSTPELMKIEVRDLLLKSPTGWQTMKGSLELVSLRAKGSVSAMASNPDAPTISSGFESDEMWDELATVDPSKVIDASHIPVLSMSKVLGLETALEGKVEKTTLAGYLPLTGGTLTGGIVIENASPALTIKRSGALTPYIRFAGMDGTNYGEFGAYGGEYRVWDFTAGTWRYIIHSGNISQQSVASAAKLTSKAYLWGQEFDGSKSVTGGLTSVDYLKTSGSYGLYKGKQYSSTLSDDDIVIYHGGSFIISRGTDYTRDFVISSSGNVLIGTTSEDSEYKLKVNGKVYANAFYVSPEDKTSYVGTSGYGYMSLVTRSNELTISGQNNTSLYVNYRKAANGYAPSTWNWLAGTSSSWANFVLGAVDAKGNIVGRKNIIAYGAISAQGVDPNAEPLVLSSARLPIATTLARGAVKIGEGMNYDEETGVLSAGLVNLSLPESNVTNGVAANYGLTTEVQDKIRNGTITRVRVAGSIYPVSYASSNNIVIGSTFYTPYNEDDYEFWKISGYGTYVSIAHYVI